LTSVKILSPKQIAQQIIDRHKLPTGTEVMVKSFSMDAKAEGDDPYLFTATITTDSLDRDREVLIPAGCNTTEFEKGGAIFWNHDYDRPIAGHVRLKRSDHAISATARFPQREQDFVGDFFPDYARALVAQGVVRGVSVGLLPIEARYPTKHDFEVYGPNVQRIVSKWKLLEWSLAPVQSNPDAVVEAVGKGLITRAFAHDAFGVDVPEVSEEQTPSAPAAPKRLVYFVEPPSSPAPARPSIEQLVSYEVQKRRGRLYPIEETSQ
jgi:hypothetical protein